jgi:hypothetical protein
MTRPPLLLLLAPLLGACVNVASVATAVPPGAATFDSGLVGTWELMTDTSVSSRLVVTRETATEYMVRDLETDPPSTVFMGRLAPLGPSRWVFELTPVGDTTHFRHTLSSKDSTRLLPPDEPLMLPLHMPLVIARADTGLVVAVFNGDSVAAAVKAGRVKTPYTAAQQGDISVTVLLTEEDPQLLNTALERLADLPGVLITLRRVGRRLWMPAMH